MKIKEQIIQARLQGMTYREITEEYGIPKSTAQDWVASSNSYIEDHSIEGSVNQNLNREKSKRFQKTEDEVLNFLEQLSPISVYGGNPISRDYKTENYALVIGDMHFPKQCDKTLSIFLQVAEELNPSSVILNGDTVDLLAVSRYPKDIRHNYTLLDERVAYHKFLDNLITSVSDNCKIYEVNANHSGNDVTGRWWRYLSERLGELASLPDIRKTLSYESVFLGDYSDRISLVDYVNITDDFIILHGDVVRKNGGYSARGMMEKLNISLMHNHTHRIGSTAQRIPAIGNRKDRQIFAWENGCSCDLNPIYASSPNWQNGFSIIGIDTKTGNYSVEQVKINNGQAHISTLGKTYIA